MAEILRFTDEHGAEVLVESSGAASGIVDASGRDVFRDTQERIETALGKVRGLADTVARELKGLESAPEQVSVEIGVNFTAEADVFIARTSAQGSLKVTLTWRGGPEPS